MALGSLVPWENNPKRISKAAAKRLLDSWEEYGQVQTVAIGPQGEVYDGHQRLSALMAVHGPGYEVDARRASRALTEDERKKLVVLLHAGAVGEWDWDILSAWDENELQGWGLGGEALAAWDNDAANLREMIMSASPIPQRPTFEDVVDKFASERGQTEKNENWFYVEFYGDGDAFSRLSEVLKEHLSSKHQLSSEYFYSLVMGGGVDETPEQDAF